MRDESIMSLVQANMNKVYLALKQEQSAYLGFVLGLKAFQDVIFHEILPYRLRVLKIIFWLIISPKRAQEYITKLVNEKIDLMKKINKKETTNDATSEISR